MNNYLLTTLTILLLSANALAADPIGFKDETDQISYSLGYQIGGDFKKQQVSINPAIVVQGMQDALDAKEPALSQQEMTALMVALKQKVVAVQQRESVRSSQEFLDANLKKPGIKELPGGSQYRVIKAGSGPTPTLEDTVDIHFRTTRADGSTIASTYGESAARPYQVKAMLPGLQQALLEMQQGAKWEVFLPPAVRSESMENGGVLIYELELIAIHPAAGKKG